MAPLTNTKISDPNIPEIGVQKLRSQHGEQNCCYTYCKANSTSSKNGGGQMQQDSPSCQTEPCQDYEICVNCPGRPHPGADYGPDVVNCTTGSSSTTTTTSSATTSARSGTGVGSGAANAASSSSGTTRTNCKNKVLVVIWTAWIFTTQLKTIISELLFKLDEFLMKCLLCATSCVRTSVLLHTGRRVKTKWRRRVCS